MTHSMTGFSRTDISAPWGELALEIRAVNHRFLEMNIRLPEELRSLDPVIRKRVGQVLSRGKLDINVRLNAVSGRHDQIQLDEELVDVLVRTGQELAGKLGSKSLSAIDVLRWPGVVTEPEKDIEGIQKNMLTLLETALQELMASRSSEGGRLKAMLLERCTDISGHVAQVRNRLPEVRQNIRNKLQSRLDALDVSADEGRLETEIALLLNKADVDEELDRLDSHVEEVHSILSSDEPVGRRLDFLMQEFNREANTLASKSQDAETTKSATDLKVLVEQMREQVQNIE